MAKPPAASPLANMMSKAVAPLPGQMDLPLDKSPAPAPPPKKAGVPFKGGVATPPQKGTPGKNPGGPGRGNMANFKGKHAPPFTKKS
jgi:hypothetical protein